jgi:muramoyltetrapeptide carboxypeptidase
MLKKQYFVAIALLLLCITPMQPSVADEGAPLVWPKLLEPGATIMFVAPAGPPDRSACERAKKRIEDRGFHVKWRDDLFDVEGYLAGSDQRRADELMEAFTDPDVDAVFCTRGGYGCMRMLDLLDFEKIRANPKMLIGFSDITALHAALNGQAGIVSLHGPGPSSGLGGEQPPSEFVAKYFHQAILAGYAPADGYTISVPKDIGEVTSFGSGKARGRLVGGNLSLVAALEGTPYAVDCEDAILVLEDVGEAPYRIDRMLQQLKLAGKLGQIRGAVLGQFTETAKREEDSTNDDRFSVAGVLRQYFEGLGVPVLRNFPLGHVKENCPAPLGAEVEIDAEAGTIRIIRSED